MRNNRRRKYCRFTALGVTKIDYKDLDTLKSYISCLLYTSDAADE